MGGVTNSIKGILADFPMSILPEISGKQTKESPIEIHLIISGNAASVASNLRVGWHIHLALMMTTEYHLIYTGRAFVPLHNPGD